MSNPKSYTFAHLILNLSYPTMIDQNSRQNFILGVDSQGKVVDLLEIYNFPLGTYP